MTRTGQKNTRRSRRPPAGGRFRAGGAGLAFPIAIVVILLGACASPPGTETNPGTPPEASKPQVRYEPVHHLDGRPVHLSLFAQDRVVTTSGSDGLPVTRVEPLAYMLLIVTHSECQWSRKFLTEIQPELPALRRLGVRAVGLIKEKDGHPVEEWAALEVDGLTLVEDRTGDCYDFYVREKTPAISVIDPWGNVRLFAEGFIEPKVLVERIRSEDFTPVPAGAG